jgi:N-acetylmuramoyl-L-alanine amidase
MNAQRQSVGAIAVLAISLALWPLEAGAQTARTQYQATLANEQAAAALISAPDALTSPAARTRAITEARRVVAAYELLVRRFRRTGYADNALFNAARLSGVLYDTFRLERDRVAADRFRQRLAAEYPTSSLLKDASGPTAPGVAPAVNAAVTSPAAAPSPARLVAIERTVLPEAVRITLALDREVVYREETLTGPARVFFDLKGVEAAPSLADAVLRYPSDAVRQIRVGRHPDRTVRVVLDLEGVRRHTVYPLYNPFRIVIDAEPQESTPMTALGAVVESTPPSAPPVRTSPAPVPSRPTSTATGPAPLSSVAVFPSSPAAAPVKPEAPASNAAGGFSIARQLGLGVSRIVIDAGHGGHDPGAQGKGLNEADLTLDIALRLEALLQAEPGMEVVLTRRTNVYVPLEERTAIANREGADLFLSIHANASRNTEARGVETYFLSFASSPEAEMVAARENSASARDMHTLPDIIKAIALNNKLDESRDLAAMVQEALISRLRRSNKNVRSLGVKKAPFVVLIGAEMPSVLAEVSFLTNRQELQLLKSAAYKQRIAEALHAAVMRYRRSLKGLKAIASQ